MKPREVYNEFSEIGSFEHAPIDLLIGAYAALLRPETENIFKSGRHRLLSRASIAAEISIHRDATDVRKRRYSEKANSLLLAQSANKQFVAGDVHTEPLRAHLPIYSLLPSFNRLPERLAQSLFRITDSYANIDSTIHVGFACEVASSMVFNGMERFGLKSYPAFTRQDYGKITQFNTNFDLMVESDGTTIESGRYPVQVKASSASAKGRYHPVITKINFERLTNSDLSDLTSSMGTIALSSLVSDSPSSRLKLFTSDQISERMLAALEKTGPLDQEMLLTPIVNK